MPSLRDGYAVLAEYAGLGCEISIYDKKHLISLFFENAKEMPTTEITDIIQGKKEDEEELKNE